MKVGKLNSRLSRLGQKARQDISGAVGKTSKVISQVERGAKKAVGEVSKFADSKAVTGTQQALGIAGRLAVGTGTPMGEAIGGSLLGAQKSLKELRKAIPDKAMKVESRIGKVGEQARGKVIEAGRMATEKTRAGESYIGNALEKKPPKSSGFEELPFYVD